MASGNLRFERFSIDLHNRQLHRGDEPLELNSRYFDALVLLVQEAGQLVTKERLLREVWRNVPVTDEAITQCIRTLRRQLGDDATRPRFIETVPKHGYRFIASVARADPAREQNPTGERTLAAPATTPTFDARRFLLLGGAGTLGAGVAGIVGGLMYGLIGASQPLGPGIGAISIALVMLWLCLVVALLGGAGVSFGIAASGFSRVPQWSVAGGALGGMLVGAIVKLLGVDAFNLLLGRSPGDVTGGAEGALLGGVIGLVMAWERKRPAPSRFGHSVALAGLMGGAAGALVPVLGGRMMGGSLDRLAEVFPDSRLRLDPLGSLFGESGFGSLSRIVTGALEGALFAACIVGAMSLARRSLARGG